MAIDLLGVQVNVDGKPHLTTSALQGESIADFAAKVQPKDPIETHDHLSGSNLIIAGMHGCPLVADGVEITVGWSFKPPVKHFSDAVKALKTVVNGAVTNIRHQCRLMLFWEVAKRRYFATLQCERAQQARVRNTTNTLHRSTTKAISHEETCKFGYRFKVSFA